MESRTIWTLFALVLGAVAAPHAEAQIIASSGFNDASGINGNGTPNSPYTIGQTAGGRGAGEPGWAGTWFMQDGGAEGGDP